MENARPKHQRSVRSIAKFLNQAFETCDVDKICCAIGVATKAHNISELARTSGLTREIIHRSFGGNKGYPNLRTTTLLLGAMSLRLEVALAKPRRNTSVADFLNEAFRSENLDRICQSVGAAAKSTNIAEVARKAGIAPSSVHRGLSGGATPNLTTIIGVLGALDFRLKVTQREGKQQL